MTTERSYIAIDLKSFYASVECVERGLNALDTHLVVADASRTNKTICLAVSPALKAHGVGGRPRLFEVVRRVADVNMERHCAARPYRPAGKTISARELASNPMLDLDYIIAPPRMALYMEYSTRIYNIYLRHVAAEDIHVYSIDEVFIDVTAYLRTKRMTPHQMAMTMIREVLAETGITATAGIGTNLYLAKVAMDIVAKRMPPDSDGVRIAELDEATYRRKLWAHRPLTDFWRVGRGIARRLEQYGILTMGDIARTSLNHEELLYRLFGVNAELLIDHAWGWEPVTIDKIKAYRPEARSTSVGQVLTEPYTAARARIVIMEMAETVALDLVESRMLTDSMTIHIGYDCESLTRPEIRALYDGPIDIDHYGRSTPRHSHATVALPERTSSVRTIRDAVAALFDRCVNPVLLLRRLNVVANNIISQKAHEEDMRRPRQLSLFDDDEATRARVARQQHDREREQRLSESLLRIKSRFGKNAILKGLNFAEGATQRERNAQIGGHKA